MLINSSSFQLHISQNMFIVIKWNVIVHVTWNQPKLFKKSSKSSVSAFFAFDFFFNFMPFFFFFVDPFLVVVGLLTSFIWLTIASKSISGFDFFFFFGESENMLKGSSTGALFDEKLLFSNGLELSANGSLTSSNGDEVLPYQRSQ